MAQVTGVAEVVMNPNKYGKFSMLVNDNWYNTNPDWVHVTVNKGDKVSFDDGGKKYIKNLKVVGKGDGGSKGAGSYKGDNLLGVELGHASKLAMDMALTVGDDVGSEDFYKFWLDNTVKVYDYMKELKSAVPARVERPVKSTSKYETEEHADNDLSDIF